MATKHENNWLARLKEYMNNTSHHEVGRLQSSDVEVQNNEVRTQLKKKMAKEVMDARMRQAAYGYLTLI